MYRVVYVRFLVETQIHPEISYRCTFNVYVCAANVNRMSDLTGEECIFEQRPLYVEIRRSSPFCGRDWAEGSKSSPIQLFSAINMSEVFVGADLVYLLCVLTLFAHSLDFFLLLLLRSPPSPPPLSLSRQKCLSNLRWT